MCETSETTSDTEAETIASSDQLFAMIKAPKELVIEFFILFSRFESALKAQGFIRTSGEEALPAWRTFSKKKIKRVWGKTRCYCTS